MLTACLYELLEAEWSKSLYSVVYKEITVCNISYIDGV